MLKNTQVEKILDKRVRAGRIRYLIKLTWSDRLMWVPIHYLQGHLDMIIEFEMSRICSARSPAKVDKNDTNKNQ